MNPLRADTPLNTRNPGHLDWLRENKPAEVQELTVYVPCPQEDATVLCAIPRVHRLTLLAAHEEEENDAWVYFLDQIPRTWQLQELTVGDIEFPEGVRIAGGVAHLRFLSHFAEAGFDFETMIATGGLTHVTICSGMCPDLDALGGLQQLTLDEVCTPTLPEGVEVLHLQSVDDDDDDPLAFARGVCQELFLDNVFGTGCDGTPSSGASPAGTSSSGTPLTLDDVHLQRLRMHGPISLRAPAMHSLMHLETTVDNFDTDLLFPNLQSLKLVQLTPLAEACWFPDILSRHPSLQLVSVQYHGGGPRMRLLLDLDNATTTLLLVHVHVHALFGDTSLATILGTDAAVDGGTVRTEFTADEFPLLPHHL